MTPEDLALKHFIQDSPLFNKCVELIREAVTVERERCATIAEDFAKADAADEDGDCGRVPFEIAKLIRNPL